MFARASDLKTSVEQRALPQGWACALQHQQKLVFLVVLRPRDSSWLLKRFRCPETFATNLTF